MNVHDIESAARDNLGKSKAEIDRFATAAQDQTESVAGQMQSAAKDMGDKVQEVAQHLPEGFSNAINKGQDVYAKSSQELGRRVTNQPIESLLVAMAIGYVTAWFIHRRA